MEDRGVVIVLNARIGIQANGNITAKEHAKGAEIIR